MWERMDFPAVGESLSMEDLAKYRCEFYPRVGSEGALSSNIKHFTVHPFLLSRNSSRPH